MVWNESAISGVLTNPEGITAGKSNRHIIYRMLQAMYRRQTRDEQLAEATRHVNHVGFNSADARFLSSVAEKSQRYNGLTPRQAYRVGKTLAKYVGQLADIAAEKAAPSLALVPMSTLEAKKQFFASAVAESELTYSDAHAVEFGYHPDRWFDMVNAMDAGRMT